MTTLSGERSAQNHETSTPYMLCYFQGLKLDTCWSWVSEWLLNFLHVQFKLSSIYPTFVVKQNNFDHHNQYSFMQSVSEPHHFDALGSNNNTKDHFYRILLRTRGDCTFNRIHQDLSQGVEIRLVSLITTRSLEMRRIAINQSLQMRIWIHKEYFHSFLNSAAWTWLDDSYV